jgi:hypothetical protein
MANFYFLNTGNTDFATGSNWSATDGGATVNAVPASADDVFLTALSGNCTLSGSAATIKSFTCIGYTRIFTYDNTTLNVQGNITLGAGMTIVRVSASVIADHIAMTVSGALTTNGIFMPSFQPSGAITVTLSDTLKADLLYIAGSTSNVTFAGSFGFDVKRFVRGTTAGNTIIIVSGITYKTGDYTCLTEKGSAHGKLRASIPGTKSNFIVTGTCNAAYIDYTDIDASGGRQILTFNGVITNCNNILQLLDKAQFSDLTVESSSII